MNNEVEPKYQLTLVFVPGKEDLKLFKSIKDCFKNFPEFCFRSEHQIHFTIMGLEVFQKEKSYFGKEGILKKKFDEDKLKEVLSEIDEKFQKKVNFTNKNALFKEKGKLIFGTDEKKKRFDETSVVPDDDIRIYYGFGKLIFETEADDKWLEKMRKKLKEAGFSYKYPHHQNLLHCTLASTSYEFDLTKKKGNIEKVIKEARNLLNKKKYLNVGLHNISVVQYFNDQSQLEETIKLDRIKNENVKYINLNKLHKIKSIKKLYKEKYVD